MTTCSEEDTSQLAGGGATMWRFNICEMTTCSEEDTSQLAGGGATLRRYNICEMTTCSEEDTSQFAPHGGTRMEHNHMAGRGIMGKMPCCLLPEGCRRPQVKAAQRQQEVLEGGHFCHDPSTSHVILSLSS